MQPDETLLVGVDDLKGGTMGHCGVQGTGYNVAE